MESLAKVTKRREKRKRASRKAAAFLRLRIEFCCLPHLLGKGETPFPAGRHTFSPEPSHTCV